MFLRGHRFKSSLTLPNTRFLQTNRVFGVCSPRLDPKDFVLMRFHDHKKKKEKKRINQKKEEEEEEVHCRFSGLSKHVLSDLIECETHTHISDFFFCCWLNWKNLQQNSCK